MTAKTYPDAVSNAFSAMMSWRTSFFVAAGLAAIFAIGLLYQANKAHVVLMPYAEALQHGGNVKLDIAASNYGTANPEYVSAIAISDISVLLNWTPESVVVQHQRFLNRLTPSLYAEQNIQLLQQAEEFRVDGVTQSFFPLETKVAENGKVRISGTLVRWTGEKETLRIKAAYTITYSKTKGYIHVDALSIEK